MYLQEAKYSITDLCAFPCSMPGGKTLLFLILSGLTSASCDVDLRSILDRAAYQLAIQSGTTLNQQRLKQGVCIARNDEGANNECAQQRQGKHHAVR